VQYAVDDAAGLDAMMARLTELAMGAAPGAVRDAKVLARYVAEHKIGDALAKETARRIAARRTSAEGKEGLAAFLEKRKPEWNA
jgi:methylglutaconyl-CoA hydratase